MEWYIKIVKNAVQPKRRRRVEVFHGLPGKMDWELACHEILISGSASVVLSFPKFESTGKTFLSTAEAIYSNKVFKLLKRHVPANIF